MLKQDTGVNQTLTKQLGTKIKSDLATFIKKSEDDNFTNNRREYGRDDGRKQIYETVGREETLYSDEDNIDQMDFGEAKEHGKNYLSLY